MAKGSWCEGQLDNKRGEEGDTKRRKGTDRREKGERIMKAG